MFKNRKFTYFLKLFIETDTLRTKNKCCRNILDHYVTHSPSDTLYKPGFPKHLVCSNLHRFE